MIRNKTDVDKYVDQLLLKVKNENERNLRCYHIAQLYYKIQDFDSARQYIQLYLTVRDDSPSAHKLLGQCCEKLGKKKDAVGAYTKSLKIEAEQSDLILRICDLLCDNVGDFDPGLAKYWWERASSLFPHSPPVFMLKDKLRTTENCISSNDYEDLLHAELKARPTDIDIRTKLLKLYAESGRSESALNNAFEIESRQVHSKCLQWYRCIDDVCNIYYRESYAKCGWEFYIQWLSALDRICLLLLNENGNVISDLTETIKSIFSLDQRIYKATSHISKGSELYEEFIKYISAQLVFYVGVVLMKIAKKDNSLWKDIKRWLGPLFLLGTSEPPCIDKVCTMSIKDGHRKLLNSWIHQANCRLAQAGYMLISLAKEAQSEKLLLDKINHRTAGDWRKMVFDRAFGSIDDRDANASSSYFLTCDIYSKISQKIPTSNNLKASMFVSSFEHVHYGSLHHLVWLGLQSLKKSTSILNFKIPANFRTTAFKSIQFSCNNLNNTGVETINQLDIDSFLFITVFCTSVILDEQKSNRFYSADRPHVFPADISAPLCNSEQTKWSSSELVYAWMMTSNQIETIVSKYFIAKSVFW